MATKGDIAGLAAATKKDIAELRTVTKKDIAELRTATKNDIAELRTATKNDIAELRTGTQSDIVDVRAELAALRKETEFLATKDELYQLENSLVRWIVGIGFALAALNTTVVALFV